MNILEIMSAKCSTLANYSQKYSKCVSAFSVISNNSVWYKNNWYAFVFAYSKEKYLFWLLIEPIAKCIGDRIHIASRQKQAQMCAEGCEGAFLYSLISIQDKVFSTKGCLV